MRAMTKRCGSLERAEMRSSVMPSLKYSCSRSPLMLVKGRTAIEGILGSGSDECQPRKREHASAPVFSQGPLRRLGRCASDSPALQHYPEHPHWPGYVFHFLLASILVTQRELVSYLLIDSTGDTDAAGVGETLEAGGDVDAVAVDLLAIHHHVAEVDADAEFHSALGWDIRVFRLERGLDLDGAQDRIDDAGKLGEDAVAGG